VSAVVIGADPGVVTGIAMLAPGERPWVIQCSAPAVLAVMQLLVELAQSRGDDVTCAGERFITGRGPGARGVNATVTRELIDGLSRLPARWHWRSAAEVKPWATDTRLEAAGLLRECHGLPHGADACRHLLFCGARDLGWPDPLSREGGGFWHGGGSRAREELAGP
jgi:hypothetical protein